MNDLVKKIKDAIDYYDFFSRFLRLKKIGSTYMSICPFHPDSQPSLSVDIKKGLWYCFGCNRGGDVFNFIMELESCNFIDSLKYISELLGIEFSENNEIIKRQDVGEVNHELYSLLSKFYHNVLSRSSISINAREYLFGRKIPMDIVEKYELGYSPKNVENLKFFCQKKGINFEVLEKAGILYRKGRNYIDILSGRIVIPIFGPNSKIIGFAGRIIDNEVEGNSKYINTIGLVKNSTLYGIQVAKNYIKSTSTVIIVEGYFDVWSMYLSDYKNVVSIMGITLSNKQIEIVKKYAKEVIILLDADKSGLSAIINLIIQMVSNGLKVKIGMIENYKDPHEVYFNEPNKIKVIMNNLITDLDFMISFYLNQVDVYEKQRILEKYIVTFLSSIKGKVVKDEYINKFCLETSINKKYLLKMLSKNIVLKNDSEEEVIKKYGMDVYILVFAFFNFDIFKKNYQYFDSFLFEQKELSDSLYKYLIECIKSEIYPSDYILHENKVSEVLKIVAKINLELEEDQKEKFLLRLLDNLRKKKLIEELKSSIVKGDYEKAREIQEKIKGIRE